MALIGCFPSIDLLRGVDILGVKGISGLTGIVSD
jgi:hypothetical protein